MANQANQIPRWSENILQNTDQLLHRFINDTTYKTQDLKYLYERQCDRRH